MYPLKDIPLFEGVNPAQYESLAGFFGPVQSYAMGQSLMTPGDRESDVFFLLEGRVRLALHSPGGDAISYREIVPYDYFGWLSAMDGRERITSAVALEPTKTFTIKANRFRELLYSHPRIAENFMRRMGDTLRRYTERIQELTLLPARGRIVRELARRFDVEKTIDLGSHEDFATWTGTTRETVTRTLTALENEGFIQKNSRGYQLLKPFDQSESWLSD